MEINIFSYPTNLNVSIADVPSKFRVSYEIIGESLKGDIFMFPLENSEYLTVPQKEIRLAWTGDPISVVVKSNTTWTIE